MAGTRTKTKELRIRLPKIGWIRIRKSREYPTGFESKQLRIIRKATGYFAQIIFVSNESIRDVVPGEISLGLDAPNKFICCYFYAKRPSWQSVRQESPASRGGSVQRVLADQDFVLEG